MARADQKYLELVAEVVVRSKDLAAFCSASNGDQRRRIPKAELELQRAVVKLLDQLPGVDYDENDVRSICES